MPVSIHYICHACLGQIKKIVSSSIIGDFKTHNNRRTRIPRWLGLENEENVARTRNCCGGPSSPRVISQSSMINKSILDKEIK